MINGFEVSQSDFFTIPFRVLPFLRVYRGAHPSQVQNGTHLFSFCWPFERVLGRYQIKCKTTRSNCTQFMLCLFHIYTTHSLFIHSFECSCGCDDWGSLTSYWLLLLMQGTFRHVQALTCNHIYQQPIIIYYWAIYSQWSRTKIVSTCVQNDDTLIAGRGWGVRDLGNACFDGQ